MPKYYSFITERTTLARRTGSALIVSPDFYVFSAKIISECTLLQQLMQNIIYTSHGAKLSGARKALKDFPSPKARVEFLCSFPYSHHDPLLLKVFDFSRSLFKEIYELRNILAHEVWASSQDYEGSILFSTLDEESRLLMVSGRMWYNNEATPNEVFDATVRFIRSTKVVSFHHLKTAVHDISICSWSLMHINNVLNEEDSQRKEQARLAFLVYQGTSHLFEDRPALPETVDFRASKAKTITGSA